jgi:hypothetical protein
MTNRIQKWGTPLYRTTYMCTFCYIYPLNTHTHVHTHTCIPQCNFTGNHVTSIHTLSPRHRHRDWPHPHFPSRFCSLNDDECLVFWKTEWTGRKIRIIAFSGLDICPLNTHVHAHTPCVAHTHTHNSIMLHLHTVTGHRDWVHFPSQTRAQIPNHRVFRRDRKGCVSIFFSKGTWTWPEPFLAA